MNWRQVWLPFRSKMQKWGDGMALSAFLNVNGYDFPCPMRGFQYTISTTVNAGRNSNNAAIGQRVGRDLIKLGSMQWNGLKPEIRRMMLSALEPFYVPVTFEDYRSGKPITLTMYPGDRTGNPLFVDRLTHMITVDETFGFNLIDAGWE